MHLSIFNDNGTITKHHISNDIYNDPTYKDRLGYIDSKSKENNALEMLRAYFSNSKIILFDPNNKTILSGLENMGIGKFGKESANKTILDDKNFSMMFFTSGSTGIPTGALKSRENLLEEIKALNMLLETYKIKKVVVTVPFIHIYGTLWGLLYPVLNNLDITIKEHFLPNDLLEIINDNTMVVTTPLYIKALNRLNIRKKLNKSLFISSTAPLGSEEIKIFTNMFDTNIIQIYGSTETGGIAYKKNLEELWTPFENVTVRADKESTLVVKSPFVSKILYDGDFIYTDGEFETFDYIELIGNRFRLLGRSSKIIKIAGKRYSTVQIENILENTDGISKAIVFTKPDTNSLRGEILDITIESDINFSPSQINKILQAHLSTQKFSIQLNIVDDIPTSSLGKKMLVR